MNDIRFSWIKQFKNSVQHYSSNYYFPFSSSSNSFKWTSPERHIQWHYLIFQPVDISSVFSLLSSHFSKYPSVVIKLSFWRNSSERISEDVIISGKEDLQLLSYILPLASNSTLHLEELYACFLYVDVIDALTSIPVASGSKRFTFITRDKGKFLPAESCEMRLYSDEANVEVPLSVSDNISISSDWSSANLPCISFHCFTRTVLKKINQSLLQDLNTLNNNARGFSLISVFPFDQTALSEDVPALSSAGLRQYVTISDTNLNKDILDLYASQHILIALSSYPSANRATTEFVNPKRTVILGSIHDYEGFWIECCELVGEEDDSYVVSAFTTELSRTNAKNASPLSSDFDTSDMSLFDVHVICEGNLSPFGMNDAGRDEDCFQSVELKARVSSKPITSMVAFDASPSFSVGWLTIKFISPTLPVTSAFSDVSLKFKNAKMNFIEDINSKMPSLFPVQPNNLIQYDSALCVLSLICYDIARSPYNPMNLSKSSKYYFHQLDKILSYFISFSSSSLTVVPYIQRFFAYFCDSDLILSLLFSLNVYFQEWLTSSIAQQVLSLRSLSSSSSTDFDNLTSETISRFSSFDQFYYNELASPNESNQFSELKKIVFLLSVVKHFLNRKECLSKYSQNDWKKISKLEFADISYLQEISLDFLEIVYSYRYYLLSVMLHYLENDSDSSFCHIRRQLEIFREVSLLTSELLDFINERAFILNPKFNPKENTGRKFSLPKDNSVDLLFSFLSLSFERLSGPVSSVVERNLDILYDLFIKSFYQMFLRFDSNRNDHGIEITISSRVDESRPCNHDELTSLATMLNFMQSHLVPLLSSFLTSAPDDGYIFIIDKSYELIGILHSVFSYLFSGLVSHEFLTPFSCFSNIVAVGGLVKFENEEKEESVDGKNRIILFYLSELIKFYHHSFDEGSSSSPTAKEFSLFFDSNSLQPVKANRNAHHPIHSSSSSEQHYHETDSVDFFGYSSFQGDDYYEGISFISSQSDRLRSLLLVNEIVMDMEKVVAEKKTKSEKEGGARFSFFTLPGFGSIELIQLKSFCYLFWREILAKESKFLAEVSLMKRLFFSCSVSSLRDIPGTSTTNNWLLSGLQSLWECFLQVDNRFFSFYQSNHITKRDEAQTKSFSISFFSCEAVSIQDFSILLLHYFSCYNGSSLLLYEKNRFTREELNKEYDKEVPCLVNGWKKSLFQLTKNLLSVIIKMIANVYCSKEEWSSSEPETTFTYFSYFLEIFLFSLREIIGIHFLMTLTMKWKLLSSSTSLKSSFQLKQLISSIIYFLRSNDWNENIDYLFGLLKMISFLSLRLKGGGMTDHLGPTKEKQPFTMCQVVNLFENEVFSMIVEIVSFQSIHLLFHDSPDLRRLLISEKDLATSMFSSLSLATRSSCNYLFSVFNKLFEEVNSSFLSQSDRNLSHRILYHCLVLFMNEIPSFAVVQNQSMLRFLSDSRLWFLSMKFSFLQTVENEQKSLTSLSSSIEQKESSTVNLPVSSSPQRERLINILNQNYLSNQLFSLFQNGDYDITAVVNSGSYQKIISSMSHWVSYFRTDILRSSCNNDGVMYHPEEGNERDIFSYLNQSCLAFYSLQRFFLRLCWCHYNSKSDDSSSLSHLLLQILENEQDISFFREALQSLLSCGCWEVGIELSQFMLFLIEALTETTIPSTPSKIAAADVLTSPVGAPHSASRHKPSSSPGKAGTEQLLLSSFSSTSKSFLLSSHAVPASPSSPPVMSLLSPRPSTHSRSPFKSSLPSSSFATSPSVISPLKRKETFKSEIQRILLKFQDKLKFDGSLRFSKQYLAIRFLTSSLTVFPVKSSSLLTEEAKIFLNKIERLNLINLSDSEEIKTNGESESCWSESWLLLSFDMLSCGNIAEFFNNDYLEILQYETSDQSSLPSSLSSPLAHNRVVEEVILFFVSFRFYTFPLYFC
jgi:hypothetical protein